MANYTPTGTSVTDYSSTKFSPGDTLTASYSGAVNPILLPAGLYQLECQGGWGGVGYAGTVTSSSSTGYTTITSSNYSSYFSVSNNSYYFAPDTSGFWTATGKGVSSSTSKTTWTCSSAGAYRISYYYNTEQNFDKFSLTIGGTSYLSNASGSGSSSIIVSLNSGSTIVATYAKDGSVDVSGENAYIAIEKSVTNTTYTPSITSSAWGGYGGYSTGILNLEEPTTLYLYVGGQGNYSQSATRGTAVTGGFNGGGSSMVRYSTSYYSSGGGGGGASDIRIGQDSLYARVIVAGGGGGGAGTSTNKYGGGLSGGSAVSAYQATQTAPGTNGSFGVGANATGSSNYNYGPGGGGGGWYGGGASNSISNTDENFREYNGGGSGYVYTASTAANYPDGCLLNSKYYLYNASTSNGTTPYPVAQTTSGAIKITCLTPSFVKINSTTHAPIKAVYVKTDSTTWKGGKINGYL